MPHLYRREWPDTCTPLEIELVCFRIGLSVEDGGLGMAEHFWRITSIMWPKGSRREFIRHPWAETMIEAACEHKYLSVSGAASSGKSDCFAAWALVNWLCAPLDTMVLVTSTSLKESRKRIWGAIVDYYRAVPGLPGKLVDSIGLIRTQDKAAGVLVSDRCGIALVSGDKSKEQDNIGKLIGIKNKRVILIGDELPELSPALVHAATSNLAANPFFQFIGIGNPNSIYDPHGTLSTPKFGWPTVSPKDTEWKTVLGYAIRFDAEQSPNVLADKVLYDFLPTTEKLEKARDQLGPDSLSYWRMWRGFWCPEGSTTGVYSENDILAGDGQRTTVDWEGTPTPVAGLDLGFTNGGDKTMAVLGLFGLDKAGIQHLHIAKIQRLTDERSNKKPHMIQIGEQFKEFCVVNGVTPNLAGVDSSGGGTTFADYLAGTWDGSIYRVCFGGAPSNLPVGTSFTPAKDRFSDRVSELWYVGKDFLRGGQITGITTELAAQMVARLATTEKSGGSVKMAVESKKKLRSRTQMSPDLADAFFVMLEVARARLRFKAQALVAVNRHREAWWQRQLARDDSAEKGALPQQLPESLEQPPVVTRRKFKLSDFGVPNTEGWGGAALM